MIESRFKTLSKVAIFIALTTLVAAQAPPAVPPPMATPTPFQEKTQSALKLAGLVTFVANSCPTLQPNYARFEQAINALGVAKADLDKADLRSSYLTYAARYNADVKANCQRADAQFGPRGTTLADIFESRSEK